MKKLPIYFGCALAYAPEEYKKEIASFKAKLAAIPWIHLFEFCVPKEGEQQSSLDPAYIYHNDIIEGVGRSFVVLGDLTYPSTGLGAELAVAMREHKVRTMMFAKEGVVVSKLWIGAPTHNPHTSFVWYKESLSELYEEIVSELQIEYNKV